MVFTCERCLIEFAKKEHLKTHLKKKNPCKSIDSDRPRKDILDALQKRELNDKT